MAKIIEYNWNTTMTESLNSWLYGLYFFKVELEFYGFIYIIIIFFSFIKFNNTPAQINITIIINL